MVITPKVRGFICTTAHPAGCMYNVNQQIDYVKANFLLNSANFNPALRVLVIGGSTGYGLASRIVTAFGCKAATLGVFFERSPLESKTGSPGWYNVAAFEQAALQEGLYAKSINGDAFSTEIKTQTMDLIKQDLAQVDLIIYSLASPRRTVNGISYNSVLKPVGKSFVSKTLDIHSGKVSSIEILPANSEELEATIKVMGGEDLNSWVELLHQHKLLAHKCKVLAYSYIGPEITYPIYRYGTIGHAKEHLEITIKELDEFLAKNYQGKAIISVNKALVTQASAAIPVVPLYISLLYKSMKARGLHEGCIEQITRLFKDQLLKEDYKADNVGRIRMDDWEINPEVQAEVNLLWQKVNTENLLDIADLSGYREEFYRLFGFNFPKVDYSKDYSIDIAIPSIECV